MPRPVAFAAIAARMPVLVTAAALVLGVSPRATQQAAPVALDVVLRNAAAYVDRFASDASGIVLEETYIQQSRGKQLTTRRMRSDVLITADRMVGWYEFRDVFEVDGKPVRDRDDRLAQLFAQTSSSTLDQARRIVAEGARFNLNPDGMKGSRTLNLPTAAMFFLRTVNQRRSSFNRNGFATIDDRRVTVVDFRETGKPRLIGSLDDAAAKGTFWIDPESGTVLRSVLRLATGIRSLLFDMSTRVDYAPDARVPVWLPKTMEEHYEITPADGSDSRDAGGGMQQTVNGRVAAPDVASANVTLEGSATYANVRKFTVAVDEKQTN
ncbi:MAG: hypothetical protein ABI634_18730 [Acidobacteriota bacterium]